MYPVDSGDDDDALASVCQRCAKCTPSTDRKNVIVFVNQGQTLEEIVRERAKYEWCNWTMHGTRCCQCAFHERGMSAEPAHFIRDAVGFRLICAICPTCYETDAFFSYHTHDEIAMSDIDPELLVERDAELMSENKGQIS